MQTVFLVFFDISFIVYQENTDLAVPQIFCVLNQYLVAVLVCRFHTVAAYGNNLVCLLSFTVCQQDNLFSLRLSDGRTETGSGAKIVSEKGDNFRQYCDIFRFLPARSAM